ncbi:hypothetical protein [Microbacterium sp. NC79]|uniref:hypothetical protein n=1 Tax=Microbacterium sp. NC79 TaxID=2851009 RepID=UPI001C2BD26A|nr:hypothetical protein [Microbacterium sp. NC79]MBV0895626.1 hypothetical protein [Microbacterium sp. NC79]
MTDPQYPGPPPPLPSPPVSPSYPGFGAPPPPSYLAQPPYVAQPSDGSSSWPAPPQPKKKRRTGLIITMTVVTLAAIAGVIGFIMWQSAAEATYEAAVAQLEQTQDDVVAANTVGTATLADAEVRQLAADTIAQTATAGLFDPALAQSFTDSVTALDDALAGAPDALSAPRSPGEMPALPWEREAEAAAISARADAANDDIVAFDQGIAAVATATTTVDSAATDFFGSATEYSESLLAENIAAKNETKLSFERASSVLTQLTQLDGSSATAVSTYVDAATVLVASQQAELDEKAGPLLTARLEVEQFARDLAPGLMLDFDWAPIVAGAGGGLSVGGTTHWWMDPGYATITLSDSVAELWGSRYDSMVRALVAHEIGHALTIRCGDMYDWSTQESIEQWATAWAIARGYTGEGNGVSVYGEPPQSMVEAAQSCS